MVRMVLCANSLRTARMQCVSEQMCGREWWWDVLPDGLSDELICCVVHAGSVVSICVRSDRSMQDLPCRSLWVGYGCQGRSGQHYCMWLTSSMTSTLDRFKMARAMQSNCFSLECRCQSVMEYDKLLDSHPVEKFSPPSDTGASRLRNTFAFTTSEVSSGTASSAGMR